ncbi:MAG: efflux RND transporter periplasmic adaptor subunit [Odoribacter sp.]|nr:efflux RND transporter periplasmic adaptor subunit [Odoribacter sp.]
MKLRKFMVVLLAILAVSCKPDNNRETDTSEEEVIKIRLTSYSSEFEVFAEADPLVAGKTANILSHFTCLSNFKALDSAVVTIRLIVDGKEVTQTLEKSTRKGIFSFDLKPTVPGRGSVVFEVKTPSGFSKVYVPSVVVYNDEQVAVAEAVKLEPSMINTIVFTKEQSWKIDFSTIQPVTEPFGQVIKTTAQIQSAPDDEIIVSAGTNGVVVFSGSNVLEGQSISSGQSLFTISGAELADNNSSLRYTQALNNYKKAKENYERQIVLAKDKIVSEKELLSTKNEYDNATAIYEMLSKNFNISGQNVSCPFSGFVKQLFVKNGQYVEAGQPVISVSKNKTIILKAGVRQKFASILGSVKSANIRIPGIDKTYTLEELNGKVISHGRNADNDNYLIPVSLQIDNLFDFIPGGFAEIYLKTITNTKALTVPNTSLLEEQGIYFVLVQVTPELFEKREVKLGPTDGLRSEISVGLVQTDRIVSKGAILVKLAQASGTLDPHAGHVH